MSRPLTLLLLRTAVAAGVLTAVSSCGNSGAEPMCANATGDRKAQVCARWKCDRADRSEGVWTGDLLWCSAGDNLGGRARALKMVNLYRFLAQLPEVIDDPARNQKAQKCALMMHANGQLEHAPPSWWACHTADGAQAASQSSLASAPGVEAVDAYTVDPGNPTSLGHRRWLLSPQLGPVGLGTTSQYSCLWVMGGTGTATRPWVAWPPPGPFPYAAFHLDQVESVHSTGWSIQSDTIDLSGAQVRLLEDGVERSVVTSSLDDNAGSAFAIRFAPVMAPEAGRRYDVEVTGIAEPISYSVEVVDCP